MKIYSFDLKSNLSDKTFDIYVKVEDKTEDISTEEKSDEDLTDIVIQLQKLVLEFLE